MNKNIIITIVILVFVAIGGFFLMNQNTQKSAMEQEKMMTDTVKAEDTTMMEKKDTTATTPEKTMMNSYTGTVIAGEASPYLEFTKADYDKAMQEGKIIFLEFYANWCPICRAQAPKLVEGFTVLNDKDVVGFRVNYNDDETEEFEKQLAKDFDVTYQHTHVILKDGKVVHTSNDDLDKNGFLDLIETVKK